MTDTADLHTELGLGRAGAVFDERSRNYPARGAVFDPSAPLVSKTWRRPGAYDQGDTSHCVAYSMRGIINTQPISRLISPALRRNFGVEGLYRRAQQLDPWPGEAYNGTSVLAGMQALAELAYIEEYRWCFGIADTLSTLSHHGPVVIGIEWYQSMFTPGQRGRLQVLEIDGAGGHAVELHGIDVRRREVIGTNSWGPTWGANGRFRLGFDELEHLLSRDGESVTVV